MKKYLFSAVALAFFTLVGTNASAQTPSTTTTTITEEVTVHANYNDELASIDHSLTPEQRASAIRVLNTAKFEMAHPGISDDLGENDEGHSVIIHRDVKYDGDNDHYYFYEALPVRDKHENRVRAKIQPDGDIKYRYVENDKSGLDVSYKGDDVIIEYDYSERSLNDLGY